VPFSKNHDKDSNIGFANQPLPDFSRAGVLLVGSD
jgi:hypothetical protein